MSGKYAVVALTSVFFVMGISTLTYGQNGGGAGAAGGGGPAQQPAAPEPEAGPVPVPEPAPAIAPSYGPLEGWFQWKNELNERYGFAPRANVDLISQNILEGPDDADDGSEYVWRYDFAILQQLWEGAQADLQFRGGNNDDIAATEFGSTHNLNQYAGTPSEFFVLHLWIEQKLFDDQLTLRGGKMDVGDWIDVNRFGYYNLLGFSQNHNAAIPFPNNPLAAMFTVEPKDSFWFFSAGAANSRQSPTEAGFKDLADGDTDLFAIAEWGLKIDIGGQPGIYRFIGWYDDRELTSFDGGTDDDRAGVALSFDQNVTDKFGLFARFGYSDQEEFNPQIQWQAGFDIKEPIPGRRKDDLAIGVVQHIFADEREDAVTDASDSEIYVEAYYNIVIYDWLQIQPVLQVLVDPGGTERDEAWIFALHMALRF